MATLPEQIKQIAEDFSGREPEAYRHYLKRLAETDPLTRDESGLSHFCVYFLPYNPKTKQIFLVHHKKSGLWLSPGGHIDKGELLLDTLNREIGEELGMQNFFPQLPDPFLITVTPIDNQAQTVCKEHLDIWFLVETDGANFHVDLNEFHSTKWVDYNEAKKLTTDENNLKALKLIYSKFSLPRPVGMLK